MKYVFLFSLIFSWLMAPAQKKHSKQFKTIFAKAEKNFEYGYYQDALDNYMKIYLEDTLDVELNYKIAMCHYYERHQPDSTLKFLLHDDASNIPDVQLLMGKLFHRKHDFNQARLHYEKYKNFPAKKRSVSDAEVNRLIEISNRAESEIKKPHKAVIKNLGQEVNSKFDEYVPLISGDSKTMYFTSKRPGGVGNLKDVAGNYFEDIYVSKNNGLGWSIPENIGKPINTKDHDACVFISKDGKQMLLYRPAKNNIGGDLYESYFVDNKWTNPKKLSSEINNNEGNESSACISHDGSLLIFSSNKKGGFGGKDLYMCKKLDNGSWGKAVNLGPTVNTPYDEDAPYLTADDLSLYFSSKGHQTLGEYDVFKSKYENDKKKWALPENLGFPLNNVGDDIFFTLSSDGKKGYYSSEKDEGFGGEDIYQIDLLYQENELHPRKIAVFELGSERTKPIQAKLTIKNQETNEQAGVFRPEQKDGRVIIQIKPYTKYEVLVQSEGYEDYIFSLDELRPENENREISIELKKK